MTTEEALRYQLEIDKIADRWEEEYTARVDKAVNDTVSGIIDDLRELTKGGGVFTRSANSVKKAYLITKKIEFLIENSPELKETIKELPGVLDKITGLNSSYINAAFAKSTNKAVADELKTASLQLLKQSLTKDMIRAKLHPELANVVIREVAAGGNIKNVREALAKFSDLPAVNNTVKTIARDTVFGHSRNTLNLMAAGLKIEKYLYAGSKKGGTRAFCAARADKVFDAEEVLSWNKEKWEGKKPGDILANAGGYNCRHRLIPYPNI